MAASQALRQAREGRGSPTVSLAWGREGHVVRFLSLILCYAAFHSHASKTQQVQTPTYLVLRTPLKNKRVSIGDTVPFLFQGCDFSCAFSPIEEELGEGIRSATGHRIPNGHHPGS